MDKVMCVRKRGKNVSERDKCLLIEIMKIHVNNIECKKHDAKVLNKKRDTWKVVTEEFNAMSDEKRTEEQLKVLWKDLKAKAKKQKTRETREKCKTGGDLQTYVDDISKIILEIMPQVYEGIDSACDDDVIIANFVENDENCMKTKGPDGAGVGDLEGELVTCFDISEDSSPDVPINVYDAGSSKHDLGSKENRRRSSDQEGNLSHRHEELLNMQLSFLLKEHEEKMAIMKRQREMHEEAHALRMDILQSLKNKLSVIPIEGSLNFINYLDKASEVNEILSETSE